MNAVGDHLVARATDDSFVNMLSNALIRIVNNNESRKGVVTRFHSMSAPPISIPDYVNRIARHVRCSNECFVLALVYIDRITKMHKNFVVSILNVHRLIITAVMLAAKFSDDVYFSNKFYAQVGGVNVTEINMLESQFLSMLNFQLYVSALEYESCRMEVEKTNYLGSVPANVWGLAWYNAAAKRSDVVGKESGQMSMMPYASTQPTTLACSTRSYEGKNVNEQETVAHSGHFTNVSSARQYCKGSNPCVHYSASNQDATVENYPIGAVTGFARPVENYPRQSTRPSTGYHVLSNVHMPQIASTPRVEPPGIATPLDRFMPVPADACGVFSDRNTSDYYNRLMFPAAPFCKQYASDDSALRPPSHAMLNRMCTQHVDYVSHPQSWWSSHKRALPMGCEPPFGVVNSVNSAEGFIPFMSAFEMRRRESLKGKCAPRSDTWNYKDNRQLYRSRNLISCNKIKEAA
ncbi:Cyclin-U4-1 [Babesia sp. Xinjiang]|uniref:Cyclin-U4-1 n=1 Tax=Babesia sp. Xinjiang TaxID=462227 RepID=UPI000A25EB0D|nr:Cyclin-U4-1 [Babesia sp. Xinjiang]ORM40739.1 Cyclin-U4-1 [Babesia sp. Xinjiang]